MSRSNPDHRDVVVECRDQILSLKSDVAKQQERSNSQHESFSGGSNEAPPALQSQVDTMLQILRQLQAQMPTQTANSEFTRVKAIDEGLDAEETRNGAEDGSNVCQQLMELIKELCLLIGDNERIIMFDEASDIVEKLKKLLDYAKCDQLEPIHGTVDAEDPEKRQLSRDIGRLSRHLIPSTRISLNGRGESEIIIYEKLMKSNMKQVQKKAHPASITRWQDRQRKEFNVGGGCLTVTTTKRKYRLRESNRRTCMGTSNKEDEADVEDFSAKLEFVPAQRSAERRMLAMSIHQRDLMNELILTIPNIFVSWVRPNDSQVFQLVTDGNLNGLRNSLEQGTASVRDHDESGRSLLFVSHSQRSTRRGRAKFNIEQYATRQPEVCQFLIKSGLDVDHIAPDLPLFDGHIPTEGPM